MTRLTSPNLHMSTRILELLETFGVGPHHYKVDKRNGNPLYTDRKDEQLSICLESFECEGETTVFSMKASHFLEFTIVF